MTKNQSTVAVTGSSGQIGSFAVEAAQAAGRSVRGLDLVPSKWTSAVLDLRSTTDWAILSGCEAVVHCAAAVSVLQSLEDPAADAATNVLGTTRLLEAARRADIGRFVYVSSAAVYGAPPRVPVTEDTLRAPLSPYGQSKASGEDYVALYERLYGLHGFVVRPFNAFSERQAPDSPYSGVVARFLSDARRGKALTVTGEGQQTRDFVAAQDVADFLVRLATTAPAESGRVFNVGTGKEQSIATLAQHVTDRASLPPPTHTVARPGEIQRSVADIRRATAAGLRSTLSVLDFIDRQLAPAQAPRRRR